ncbi:MAG: hypothetical protein WAZ18_01370 [Alphaproteobacteria bacterium]
MFKVSSTATMLAMMATLAHAADAPLSTEAAADMVGGATAALEAEAMPSGAGEKLEDYMMDAKATGAETATVPAATEMTISKEVEELVASLDGSATVVTSATEAVSTSDVVSATAAAMDTMTPPDMDVQAPANAAATGDDMMGSAPTMTDVPAATEAAAGTKTTEAMDMVKEVVTEVKADAATEVKDAVEAVGGVHK